MMSETVEVIKCCTANVSAGFWTPGNKETGNKKVPERMCKHNEMHLLVGELIVVHVRPAAAQLRGQGSGDGGAVGAQPCDVELLEEGEHAALADGQVGSLSREVCEVDVLQASHSVLSDA